jgi:hypothetical protein
MRICVVYDNTKTVVKEIGKCLNWIHHAQGRDWWLALVNTVMDIPVP